MKQRNLILTIAVIAGMSANPIAMAQSEPAATPSTMEMTGDDQIQADENAQLDKVYNLLKELAKEKTIEVDETGNIRLKPSVLDKLKKQGRLSTDVAGRSVICN